MSFRYLFHAPSETVCTVCACCQPHPVPFLHSISSPSLVFSFFLALLVPDLLLCSWHAILPLHEAYPPPSVHLALMQSFFVASLKICAQEPDALLRSGPLEGEGGTMVNLWAFGPCLQTMYWALSPTLGSSGGISVEPYSYPPERTSHHSCFKLIGNAKMFLPFGYAGLSCYFAAH